MSASENNIKFLTHTKLAKFVEKIGHYEAAKIIEERRLDGQKLLQLSKSEVFQWELSSYQVELLWNCISQIKSNPLTYIDHSQREHLDKLLNTKYYSFTTKASALNGNSLLSENTQDYKDTVTEAFLSDHTNTEVHYYSDCTNTMEIFRKPVPPPRKTHKYFKFFDFKRSNRNNECNNNQKHNHFAVPRRWSDDWDNISNASSYHTCRSINDLYMYNESDYIYPPGLQEAKNNVTIDRIKKYLQLKRRSSKNHNQEFIESCHNYLELSDLSNEEGILSKSITNTRETRDIKEQPLGSVKATHSQSPQKKVRRSRRNKFKFYIKICCFSCFVGYPEDKP